jgi:hypothetical protein
MKIIIIQEKGRHIKNQNFREALNLSRALDRIGVENIVWGLNYENFTIPFYEISKGCDALILLENYEVNGWIPDLSGFKGLKLFWSIDSHCNFNQHLNTCKKHKIDLVLNAVYGHENLFKQKCEYFPNAYPEDLIKPIEGVEKINDVGFCGNWLNRVQWVNTIERNGFQVKKDIFVIGEDMVNAINSYKIHFNRNLSVDINFRTFETMGCKTLLLTNYTPGLETLFNIGENIMVYDNEFDLIDKIKYFLSNTEHRKIFEQKSYEHVLKNHTYDVRAKNLIDIINKN